MKSDLLAEGACGISEIDLVFVGDDFPVILQSSGSGEPMIMRFKLTSNGVNQRLSSSKNLCTIRATTIAFRGLLRFSSPSRTRVENPPKFSTIASAVFAQFNFNFEMRKLQCGPW